MLLCGVVWCVAKGILHRSFRRCPHVCSAGELCRMQVLGKNPMQGPKRTAKLIVSHPASHLPHFPYLFALQRAKRFGIPSMSFSNLFAS